LLPSVETTAENQITSVEPIAISLPSVEPILISPAPVETTTAVQLPSVETTPEVLLPSVETTAENQIT
jgi:hypothetical protein